MSSRYTPRTRSDHNLYDMLSLLQKAIRRGDPNLAGYAAAETSQGFRGALWNRLMTVGSEDCWGVVSKELENLRSIDDDSGRTADWTITAAVGLLCACKKSRDACYFACNFVLSSPKCAELEITADDFSSAEDFLSGIPSSALTHDALHSGEYPKRRAPETHSETTLKRAARLIAAISTLDIENTGRAVDLMRSKDRKELWKVLLGMAVLQGGELTEEVIGLKLNDDRVNRGKSKDRKDEIYICKAVMLLLYQRSMMFEDLKGAPGVEYHSFIDWNLMPQFPVMPIEECQLPESGIPMYVYDVHTIRGKAMGRTDWEMNLVEQAALNPLQPAFFDEGSWAPRYDAKHITHHCTEGEYQASLEYRKTHEDNPVADLRGRDLYFAHAIAGDGLPSSLLDSMCEWSGRQESLF